MHRFNLPGKLHKAAGTILVPENSGLRVILSLVADDGESASPTYKLLTKRFGKVREEYRTRFVNRDNFKLGQLLNTAVSSDIWVLQGIVFGKDKSVDANALKEIVKKTVDLAKYEKGSLHVSQLTLDEAPELQQMLEQTLLPEGLSLYIYPRE